MNIKNLNHKINRKAMVKNYINQMEANWTSIKESYWEIVAEHGLYAADRAIDDMMLAIQHQEELYCELVATPIGGRTPRDILVFY